MEKSVKVENQARECAIAALWARLGRSKIACGLPFPIPLRLRTPRALPCMLLSKRLADLLWLPVNELLTGELRRGELGWLLAPQRHFALLSARRAGTLVNRVRLFAFLLAVLTPLWSVVDLLTFPFPLWGKLLLMRLMAADLSMSPSPTMSTAALSAASAVRLPERV